MNKKIIGWGLAIAGAIGAGVGTVVLQDESVKKYVAEDLNNMLVKCEKVENQDSEKSE